MSEQVSIWRRQKVDDDIRGTESAGLLNQLWLRARGNHNLLAEPERRSEDREAGAAENGTVAAASEKKQKQNQPDDP